MPNDIVIPKSEFVKEHKQLLGILKNPTKKKLESEYKKQAEEYAHLAGGLAGVSRSSGFVQRMMAEAKKNNYSTTGLKASKNRAFNSNAIQNKSTFIKRHIDQRIPWEAMRAVPVISTGQRARERLINGQKVRFTEQDPTYNLFSLPLFPLPRGERVAQARAEAPREAPPPPPPPSEERPPQLPPKVPKNYLADALSALKQVEAEAKSRNKQRKEQYEKDIEKWQFDLDDELMEELGIESAKDKAVAQYLASQAYRIDEVKPKELKEAFEKEGKTLPKNISRDIDRLRDKIVDTHPWDEAVEANTKRIAKAKASPLLVKAVKQLGEKFKGKKLVAKAQRELENLKNMKLWKEQAERRKVEEERRKKVIAEGKKEIDRLYKEYEQNLSAPVEDYINHITEKIPFRDSTRRDKKREAWEDWLRYQLEKKFSEEDVDMIWDAEKSDFLYGRVGNNRIQIPSKTRYRGSDAYKFYTYGEAKKIYDENIPQEVPEFDEEEEKVRQSGLRGVVKRLIRAKRAQSVKASTLELPSWWDAFMSVEAWVDFITKNGLGKYDMLVYRNASIVKFLRGSYTSIGRGVYKNREESIKGFLVPKTYNTQEPKNNYFSAIKDITKEFLRWTFTIALPLAGWSLVDYEEKGKTLYLMVNPAKTEGYQIYEGDGKDVWEKMTKYVIDEEHLNYPKVYIREGTGQLSKDDKWVLEKGYRRNKADGGMMFGWDFFFYDSEKERMEGRVYRIQTLINPYINDLNSRKPWSGKTLLEWYETKGSGMVKGGKRGW